MTTKMKELKIALKEKAAEISSTKAEIKELQRSQGSGAASSLQSGVLGTKRWYRHHHIAYSLLKGKTYEQIEKPAEDNAPDMALVERIKNAYTAIDVCVSQA